MSMVRGKAQSQISMRVDNAKNTAKATLDNVLRLPRGILTRIQTGQPPPDSKVALLQEPNMVQLIPSIVLKEVDIITGHVRGFSRANRALIGR